MTAVSRTPDPPEVVDLPRWLWPVARLADQARPEDFGSSHSDTEGRPSAVLILFGQQSAETSDRSTQADGSARTDGATRTDGAAQAEGATRSDLSGPSDPVAAGGDILLIERARTLRSHAGQPAFPGGGLEAGDAGPIDAALREATEETGLDQSGVRVFGTLPSLYIVPSGYRVTPVLGWWHTPSPVGVVDDAEVASVHRVGFDELLAPENRFRVRHPSGYVGPAFDVAGLVVWGFTGGLLDQLVRLVGWERPWDPGRVRDLPEHLVRLSWR